MYGVEHIHHRRGTALYGKIMLYRKEKHSIDDQNWAERHGVRLD